MSGYASTAANPRLRELVTDIDHQRACVALRPRPSRRGDARDDARRGRARELWVELSDSLRPRIGGQRSELGVRHRVVAEVGDACIRAKDPPTAIEERELPRHAVGPRSVTPWSRCERIPAGRREQVVTRQHVGRRCQHRLRSRRRRRGVPGLALLPCPGRYRETARRGCPRTPVAGGLVRTAPRAPAASQGGTGWSRARRSPSSHRFDDRSAGRRRVARRRTWPRPGCRGTAAPAYRARSDAEAEALDDRVHVRFGVVER